MVRGESWWSIGNRYGVNYNALASHNGRSSSQTLYVGEVLRIPGTGTPPPSISNRMEVVAVSSVTDSRLKHDPGKYKVIMAPNSVQAGNSPGLGLGMMILTPNGRTIVIDGGIQNFVGSTTQLATGPGSGELANMKAWLQAHAGNRVDTWIMTHPHNDHARVPSAIIHEGAVTIDRVYGVEFPKDRHDSQVSHDETAAQSAYTYNAYNKMKQAGKYTEIKPGMTYSIDGVHLEFLNALNLDLYRENDSSAVIRVTFDGSTRSVMLLVDIQNDGAARLMSRYPNKLDADMVQMAHHGYDPLTSLYDRIKPSVVFVPAGERLYNNATIMANAQSIRSRHGSSLHWAVSQWNILEVYK